MTTMTTKKAMVLAVVMLGGWILVPAAASGNTAGGDEPRQVERPKSCKDQCLHAEAVCRGKRGACMAARQRCVKGCR